MAKLHLHGTGTCTQIARAFMLLACTHGGAAAGCWLLAAGHVHVHRVLHRGMFHIQVHVSNCARMMATV